jgi:hypothetical protein
MRLFGLRSPGPDYWIHCVYFLQPWIDRLCDVPGQQVDDSALGSQGPYCLSKRFEHLPQRTNFKTLQRDVSSKLLSLDCSCTMDTSLVSLRSLLRVDVCTALNDCSNNIGQHGSLGDLFLDSWHSMLKLLYLSLLSQYGCFVTSKAHHCDEWWFHDPPVSNLT